MLRRAILAVALAALVGLVATQVRLQSGAGFMAAGAGVCWASGDGGGTGPDAYWHAPGTNASITESIWRSTIVHADLAGVRRPGMAAVPGPAHRPPQRLSHSPGLPLRIPLLI